jgi:hypothetical protein
MLAELCFSSVPKAAAMRCMDDIRTTFCAGARRMSTLRHQKTCTAEHLYTDGFFMRLSYQEL